MLYQKNKRFMLIYIYPFADILILEMKVTYVNPPENTKFVIWKLCPYDLLPIFPCILQMMLDLSLNYIWYLGECSSLMSLIQLSWMCLYIGYLIYLLESQLVHCASSNNVNFTSESLQECHQNFVLGKIVIAPYKPLHVYILHVYITSKSTKWANCIMPSAYFMLGQLSMH